MAKKTKLNYRFHNPNTPEAAADTIFEVFIAANRGKAERAIEKAAQEAQQVAMPSTPSHRQDAIAKTAKLQRR